MAHVPLSSACLFERGEDGILRQGEAVDVDVVVGGFGRVEDDGGDGAGDAGDVCCFVGLVSGVVDGGGVGTGVEGHYAEFEGLDCGVCISVAFPCQRERESEQNSKSRE